MLINHVFAVGIHTADIKITDIQTIRTSVHTDDKQSMELFNVLGFQPTVVSEGNADFINFKIPKSAWQRLRPEEMKIDIEIKWKDII